MVTCPRCAAKTKEGSPVCPACGAAFGSEHPTELELPAQGVRPRHSATLSEFTEALGASGQGAAVPPKVVGSREPAFVLNVKPAEVNEPAFGANPLFPLAEGRKEPGRGRTSRPPAAASEPPPARGEGDAAGRRRTATWVSVGLVLLGAVGGAVWLSMPPEIAGAGVTAPSVESGEARPPSVEPPKVAPAPEASTPRPPAVAPPVPRPVPDVGAAEAPAKAQAQAPKSPARPAAIANRDRETVRSPAARPPPAPPKRDGRLTLAQALERSAVEPTLPPEPDSLRPSPPAETPAPPPPPAPAAVPTGEVRVTTTLDGAVAPVPFEVDGRRVGTTPKAVKLAVGHHTLVFHPDGLEPVKRQVTVTQGSTQALTVELRP